MSRPVKKLFDIEIDEVSVVDRPANQHGVISFSKALGDDSPEEGQVPIYDSEGYEVDPELLEHGDVVYTDDGDELVYVEDGADELVGKAAWDPVRNAYRGMRSGLGGVAGPQTSAAGERGMRAGAHLRRHGKVYGGVGAAGAIGAGAYGLSKSLGDEVIEELSKAVGSAERDEIIAKAMDEVEIAKAAAAEAWEYAAAMEDQRIEDAFISKAAEYNLPVSPEVLGPILKAVSVVLDDDQLDILDQLFDAVGDALYDEVGYVGDADNVSVLDTVSAYANELVGKADVSHAEAMTAMFAANPQAYDAYINENGR